jgi:PadR family transcriptional regulator PadR
MNAQFKRGILELCIIKLISFKEKSASEILELISKDLEVNENTVYPILRRLKNEGTLTTERVSSTVGAPKKMYFITEQGKIHLEEQENEWLTFNQKVARIMEGNYE